MRRLLFYLWNLWPPFLGAGIVIDYISKDFMYVRAKLKKRPWTRNLVGTQFGGSMMAMTDPFFMTMLFLNLERDYIIWDKSTSIRFRKPGKTTLYAEFKLTSEDLDHIRNQLEQQPKYDWEKEILIKNTSDEIVAEVKKVIHIRKK